MPLNLDRLVALVEQALNAGDALSQFDEQGVRLTVRAVDGAVSTASEPDTTVSLPGSDTITSAQYGLFHLQPGGDGAPFVSIGQVVEAGQKIGLIEAMKVFSPILAHRSGRIVAVLADHGAEVEYGQPLFHVE